jgi:hypothetical protein
MRLVIKDRRCGRCVTDIRLSNTNMDPRGLDGISSPLPYRDDHPNELPRGFDASQLPGTWRPNRISFAERTFNIVLSIILLIYGAVGLINDRLYVPGRWTAGVELHGLPASLMFGTISCAAIALLSVIVDHYDTCDNERRYKQFARSFQLIAWVLCGAAGLSYLAR